MSRVVSVNLSVLTDVKIKTKKSKKVLHLACVCLWVHQIIFREKFGKEGPWNKKIENP